MENNKPILDIQQLKVSFDTYAGEVKAVRQVSFEVYPGEAVAVVGESGCGKSVTAQSIMGLIPSPPGRIAGGSILFNGENLLTYNEAKMQEIRGNQIGMIFQDPMTCLNPTIHIGKQIVEGLRKHKGLTNRQAMDRAKELLQLVGIPDPEKRLHQYPHEFSGGMRQRAMIAMALACDPKLLIADEPTTALDVTIQDQIINLMRNLQKQLGMAIILITHDLGVVAGMCSRVVVMYAGKVMEAGKVEDIYYRPSHPYTVGLLASIPRVNRERSPLNSIAGTPPDLLKPPEGCPFAPRCTKAMQVCYKYPPVEVELAPDHRVSCWLKHPLAGSQSQEVAG